MTGQSTELGRFIDGFIDNAVFTTCYLAASAYFVQGAMGWSIYLLAIPAGLISHNFGSNIYDFYKSEHLYYIAKAEGSKIRTVADVENTPQQSSFWGKFFRRVQIDYTKWQWILSTRTEDVKEIYESLAFSDHTRARFIDRYKNTFGPLLVWWALLGGTNTHRTLIMLFSIMGRFDLYLIFCIVKIVPMAILMIVQKVMDDDFHKQLEFELATN
jgi:hypothetical protein